jgi:inner membrane protein
MVGWSLLSLLPDADIVGFSLGIPYGSVWGHRGFTHSIGFAAVAGVVAAAWSRARGGRSLQMGALATVVVASHGLLDTLTDGGRGAALLWPLSAERFFAPWNPLPVSPIGLRLLSPYGLYVVAVELLVFSPLILYALWPRAQSQEAAPSSLTRE